MTTNASLQDSSSPNPTAGRSLLSRLTSPLRSRARNLVDFHIQPLEPHRQYSPGDIVKGLVVLTIGKPIRITHLTVALNGYIRVYKTPNGVPDDSADAVSLPAGNTRKTQYLGQGHASLFQDEQILCGEGRLETGIYEFEFELEFPKKGLPTSIDFERGTISYVIRSTITRPTSIAATSSCDRKISLVESVDIGLLVPPKPRVITLEPISRRSRKSAKAKARSEKDALEGQPAQDTSHRADSPAVEESASQSGSSEPTNAQRTITSFDDQSEVSAESVVSSSTGRSFPIGSGPASSKSVKISQTPSDQSFAETFTDKTITATIELLKAGCLPGDSVPLRVSIQHTKAIRSMHGIIITLYRQGRIDYAPPLSPFLDVTGKAAQKLKHEEYYPKSKTGLGGLSLSSAGSCSVFRKDLAQTFAPLIINPATMSTVVTASIRVPEDVFPTITGVPAQMIDFKYHIEVVVDLGGKLAGQDRHVPRTGIMKSTYINSNNQSTSREDGPGNFLAAWGGSVVDTDHIRREKSIVSCAFELIVGTTDSARMRGRGNTVPRSQKVESTMPKPVSPASDSGEAESYEDPSMDDHYDEQRHNGDRRYQLGRLSHMETNSHNEVLTHDHEYNTLPEHRPAAHFEQPFLAAVPPPEVIAEMDLPEKERARHAEQRLLPSQPPGDEIGPSPTILAPSAPAYVEADADRYQNGTSGPRFPNAYAGPSTSPDDLANSITAPTAPLHDEMESHTSNNPEVDKQELERQRLLAEASSPPNFPNENSISEESGGGMQFIPTAPFLEEEDHYGGHNYDPTELGSLEIHEDLPGYQR